MASVLCTPDQGPVSLVPRCDSCVIIFRRDFIQPLEQIVVFSMNDNMWNRWIKTTQIHLFQSLNVINILHEKWKKLSMETQVKQEQTPDHLLYISRMSPLLPKSIMKTDL